MKDLSVADMTRLVREKYPRAQLDRGRTAYRVRTGVGFAGKMLGIGVTPGRAWKQALVRILLAA